MNIRITRREVAKQFIVAIELLLEWIEQKEDSKGELSSKVVDNDSLESRLLTAPDVARILNISKGAAYQLIQRGDIPSVRIGRSVRVKEEDLKDFINKNLV